MESFVTINGRTLLMNDSGKGSHVLVLLHGYLETHLVYDALIQQLSEDVRIICPDMPGHGMSEACKPDNSIEYSASVIHDYLVSQGIGKVFIAGHSMGGYVAMAFAQAHPDMTEGLILFHSTPFADSPYKKADRKKEMDAIREGKMEEVARKAITRMFAPENREKMAEQIEELVAACQNHDPEGIIACMNGMQERPAYEAFLTHCLTPAVFFLGKHDDYIPLDKAAALTACCPQAMVIWLDHSGHECIVEEPASVAQALSTFIKVVGK